MSAEKGWSPLWERITPEHLAAAVRRIRGRDSLDPVLRLPAHVGVGAS